MKTHEKRALFSKAVLKATTCLFLAAGASVSPAFAFPEMTETMGTEIVQQQAVTITGVVKDKSGEPIIGANILEKGTSNGVITNVDGEYTLKVKGANSVLIVSYIGYKSQEIAVGSQRKIDVTLADDTELLDEVVVIGYGTQRKGDVTSAISSVKKDDFIQGKVSDAADLIKGKVAGLVVSKGSGDPNSGSSIRLRGVITLTGSNSPLVLIDGIPGDMSTVAPENIASVDVLKDASAAAIYGTRGANGVSLLLQLTENVNRKLLSIIPVICHCLNLAKNMTLWDPKRFVRVIRTSRMKVMIRIGWMPLHVLAFLTIITSAFVVVRRKLLILLM